MEQRVIKCDPNSRSAAYFLLEFLYLILDREPVRIGSLLDKIPEHFYYFGPKFVFLCESVRFHKNNGVTSYSYFVQVGGA